MERNLSERYHSSPKHVPQKSKSFAHSDLDTTDHHKNESTECDTIRKVEGDGEEKTGSVDDSTEENIENVHEEPPPEIHYTLETVSDDIDKFITSLMAKSVIEVEVKEEKEEKEKDGADAEHDDKDHEHEHHIHDHDHDVEKEKQEHKVKQDVPEFVNKFLDLLEEKVAKREDNEGKGKFGHVPEEDSCFIEAVNRISKLNSTLYEFHSDQDALINRVGSIHNRAMFYFEEEFRILLEDYKTIKQLEHQEEADHADHTAQEGETPEEESFFLGYSENAVLNIKMIVNVMINGGYEFECSQLYLIIRRHTFDVCLHKIGFEKISIDEVQKMSWEALEREIPSWMKTFKDCAKNCFSKERTLADSVFADYPSIAKSAFSNILWVILTQLLNFAEGVSMTKISTEKLFKFLDMYETIRDSLLLMEGLFPEDNERELRQEMTTALSRIGEAAIHTFCDLENSIKADTGKSLVPGGAVHPLTRYTMNYLKYTCEYKETLEQVFKDHLKVERADSTSRPNYEPEGQQDQRGNDENLSPFSKQLMKVMDLLDSNLDGKAKLYKDLPLSCIFMMNNGRYILQKIKGSAEIHEVMGDTWCRKKSSDLRNYHKTYQRETCNKLLGFLDHKGLQINGKIVKPNLKERFKGFNALFDEIHRTQTTWVVSDEQLQSELRVSISALVIPAYRSFLGRFSQCFTPGRQYEKYVKFQPEDIETYIEDLFDGTQGNMVKRR